MVSLLWKSFYVDDFAGGAFDDNEGGEVYEKFQTLMSSGGFTLRKWHTNSKHLQEKIATDRAENQHESNYKANNIQIQGCSAEELVRNHSWWKGPEFLNHSPEYWPQEPQQSYIDNKEKALAEIKKTSPTIVYSMANPSINNDRESFDIGDIIDINRYSTKLKLLRVTATVVRYVKRWRNPRHKFESAELTAQELHTMDPDRSRTRISTRVKLP
ncbi:Hypothetical predicted protein [Paramuricea clavata]|uniref:Uncharacterized protein n=1 Tax=Paramuricea clavata TaxID=317549 RepID=A0A7D9DVM6_PARCT|nr:Hypothetical predicted protein [Paramuricea clavata]